MALLTGPNVPLDANWTLVAENVSQLLIQLRGSVSAVVAIGATAPAAGSRDGHIVQDAAGRDTFSISGLAGEKVFARALSNNDATAIAATRG